jgi:4-amino-4-deoxy-L-arabinose transferase-like glycosyltransferase
VSQKSIQPSALRPCIAKIAFMGGTSKDSEYGSASPPMSALGSVEQSVGPAHSGGKSADSVGSSESTVGPHESLADPRSGSELQQPNEKKSASSSCTTDSPRSRARYLALCSKLVSDDRRFVWLVATFAAGVQAVILWRFWSRGPAFLEDFEDGDIARNLIEGKGYVAGTDWLTPPFQPTAHKTPGWVFVLAGIYKAFGRSQVPVTILNAALLVLLYCICFAFFRKWTNASVAKAATVLLLASPFLIKQGRSALNVPASAVLILAYLWLVTETTETGTSKRALATGLVGGALLLVHPAAAAFVPATFWYVLRPPPLQQAETQAGTRPSLRVKAVCIAIAALVVVLAPWTIRNALVFRAFVPLGSSLPLEFALGNGNTATGGLFTPAGTPIGEPPPEAVAYARERGFNEVQAYNYYAWQAWEWVKGNPGRALQLRLLAATYYFFPQNLFYSVYRSDPGFLRNLAYTLVLVGFGLPGMALAWRRYPRLRSAVHAVLWSALLYAMTHANVDAKYREPIDPLLSGFAAIFLYEAICRIRRKYEERHQGRSSPA